MTNDLATRNREHFDKHATDHQSNFEALLEAVIDELRARRGWISTKWTDGKVEGGSQQEVRLLDYACGSGTVSKALMPFVTRAVGLDISQNMVAEYNKWARDNGFGAQQMIAYQHDLLAESQSREQPPPADSLSNFDVAIVSMALHHVSDPGQLMKKLASCLRPGGVCVVLDRVASSSRPELELDLPAEQAEVLKTINKHGFDEDEMRQLYQDAGLSHNFEYIVIEHPFEIILHGRKLQLTGFISRGELE